jgi:hypothetical protein
MESRLVEQLSLMLLLLLLLLVPVTCLQLSSDLSSAFRTLHLN